MILGLVDEAVCAGARQRQACGVLGVDARSVQRWKLQGIGEDRRMGPHREPKSKLKSIERAEVIKVLHSPEYRDVSIKQIVPRLADQGVYIASESTMYRIARAEGENVHRSPAKPARSKKPRELAATKPKQVWSWDITYLMSPIRGIYFYAYVVIDVFSRKIVAQAVHTEECAVHASALISAACERENIERGQLVIHSDNGASMKGATLLARLQELGVATSFSRPSVSDDNPFSEAGFRTMKYRPEYPASFDSLESAREWIRGFERWYNFEHRHSAIRFVTPNQRHIGQDIRILAERSELYEAARDANPLRWSRNTRNWARITTVRLNPNNAARSTHAA